MSRENEPSWFCRTSFQTLSTYRGWPYGAMPIPLYSPSFTSKPKKAVKALYSKPSEWGNSICLVKRISLPRPIPYVPVTHSPTPSTVRMAASSKGEQRNALAACERWCSEKSTFSLGTPNSDSNLLATQSLSSIQVIIDSRKTFQDWG